MAEIIQLRRDISNSWNRVNPILAQGEIGYEIDTNRFKIGNGRDAWITLSYFASNDIQVEEMPTDRDFGRIVQYIGQSNQDYIRGFFYRYVDDPTHVDNSTLRLQEGQTFRILDVTTLNTRFEEIQAEYPTQTILYLTIDKYPNDPDNNGIRVHYYTAEGVTEFTTTTSLINGVSSYFGIAFEGITTVDENTYVKIYRGTGEGWKRIDVQPQTKVNDTLTSTSIVEALSANQGRVLKDLIDNVTSIGRFLAMWDADTGIARYLDVGFQYEQGDYFIIATTGETSPTEHGNYSVSLGHQGSSGQAVQANVTEDTINTWESYFGKGAKRVEFIMQEGYNFRNSYDSLVVSKSWLQDNLGIETTNFLSVGDSFFVTYSSPVNYMPSGTSYQGASTVVTTDPLQVSDMYFFDGTRWVFLPSSTRQIAVDETLDASSRNPVENRVVTQALSEKVNKSSSPNIIYATDDDGEQTILSVGEGLAIDNGQIKNTRTSAEWGNIEGNIEDQDDLVEYIDSHSSSSTSVGVPQIANVTVKQINSLSQEYARIDAEYKGSYANILFNLNLSKDQILEKMDDLYVGISRFKRNKNANVVISKEDDEDESIRYLSKFSLMNDKYVKIDHKAYCWRIDTDNGMAYSNPQRYRYFYTFDNYSDDINLLHEADPSIYTFYGQYTESNYAKCLNALRNSDLAVGKIWDPDYLQRYEEGDIDVFVNVMKNKIDNPSYTYAHLMRCRKYKNGGQTYYLWSYGNWENSTNDVYAMSDYSIPEFYGDLELVGTIEDFEDYTFVERRDDLNYYRLNESYGDLEKFTNMAQDFTLQGHSFGDTHINWLAYWMDYPVMPVLLRDCDVIAQKYVHNEELDTGVSSGDIVSLKYIVKNNLTDCLIEGQPVQFMLPYDTYYLWLRFSAWQKRCLYNEYREDTDEYLPMSYKNSITSAWDWDNGSSMLNRRAFGRQRNGYSTGNNTKVCEYVHFNLYTPANVTMGTVSSSTPIQKRLYINCRNGGSGLRD